MSRTPAQHEEYAGEVLTIADLEAMPGYGRKYELMGGAIIITSEPDGLTLADLEAMPDDGRRYELIGGAIVVTPAPNPRHQRASHRLHNKLEVACPSDHEVFSAPIDLDLPWDQRVQPDLIVVPASSVGPKRLSLPVQLVVEIVSPSSRIEDRAVKKDLYQESGVPAYWLVDPLDDMITCYRLPEGAIEYEVYAEGESVAVEWPLSVSMSIRALITPK